MSATDAPKKRRSRAKKPEPATEPPAPPKEEVVEAPPAVEMTDFYGRQLPAQGMLWAAHLTCYRDWDTQPTRLSKFDHFKGAAEALWPAKINGKPNQSAFIWHPWAEDMLDACINHRYVGLAGSSSCGKSAFLAVWGLLNWAMRPKLNMVLVTSTNVRDAKKRVWGAIEIYYKAIANALPGFSKMVNHPTPAIHRIVDGITMNTAGLFLIPSEAKMSDDVTGKMRGMKAKHTLFLLADELTDLSHAVVTTAMSNLVNNKEFHMTAAANPNSYYDPFALFVKPKEGWDSITVDDKSWEMSNGGRCLHFDALKNPNYLARENIWPIQKYEAIDAAIERIGDKPEFWRDFRAFWCPETMESFVFSGSEIIQYQGDKPVTWGSGVKHRVAGFDPSFATNGDRAILRIAEHGTAADGTEVVEFKKSYYLAEDPANKNEPRNLQIAKKLRDVLQQERVSLSNLGIDSTGGGAPFCDLFATVVGSNDFLRVMFGGKASERPVSALDNTKSCDKYVNRVSELWFYGAELLRNNQLRGIDDTLAAELTARRYMTNRGNGSRVQVEPKTQMKARFGRSPDEADAACIALEVVRERFGISTEPVSQTSGKRLSGGFKQRLAPFRKVQRFQRIHWAA